MDFISESQNQRLSLMNWILAATIPKWFCYVSDVFLLCFCWVGIVCLWDFCSVRVAFMFCFCFISVLFRSDFCCVSFLFLLCFCCVSFMFLSCFLLHWSKKPIINIPMCTQSIYVQPLPEHRSANKKHSLGWITVIDRAATNAKTNNMIYFLD